MAIVVKVGSWTNVFNDTFAACISTLKSGVDGSAVPDGDVYAFYAKDIKKLGKWKDKVKPGSGHISSKYPSDNVYVGAQLVDCIITKGTVDVSGTPTELTATEMLDVLDAFINTLGEFQGQRAYFWVKNISDEKYKKLSRNSGKTEIRYIYGYPKDPINWSSMAGEASIYRFPFVFEEVTIGTT